MRKRSTAMPIISGTCALYTASKSMPIRESAVEGFSAMTVKPACPFSGVTGNRKTIPSDRLFLYAQNVRRLQTRVPLLRPKKNVHIYDTLFSAADGHALQHSHAGHGPFPRRKKRGGH